MQRMMRSTLGLVAVCLAAPTVVLVSCGSGTDRSDELVDGSSDGSDATAIDSASKDAVPDAACDGPFCPRACAPGEETTIEGTVYAPDGKLPLFNVAVYAPTSALAPIVHGPSCDRCGEVSGDPIAAAVTDSAGHFVLTNAPSGKDVRLVLQSGKWRRAVALPGVLPCRRQVFNDTDTMRLPRSKSEGDLPRIAVVSGGCDLTPCLFTKLGIDLAEIGVASDGPSKSVHLYRGGGGNGPAAMADADTLWSDATKMAGYDIVIMGCECSENLDNKGGAPGAPAFSIVSDWLKAGGRLLTIDYSYTWIKYSPDPDIASAAVIPGGGMPITNTPFFHFTSATPKLSALSNWWRTTATSGDSDVRASTLATNVSSIDTAKAQSWATGGITHPEPKIFSFTAPLTVAPSLRCGRAVHVDGHIATGVEDVTSAYPTGCATEYASNNSEKLAAFTLFELGSCIQDDKGAPVKPQTK